MTNFKGTKGKWKAVNNGHHWNNKNIDNWTIEWSEEGEFVSYHVYDQYDALLISKAPEMLEMLETLYQQVDFSFEAFGNDTGIKMQERIKQLIKSATEL